MSGKKLKLKKKQSNNLIALDSEQCWKVLIVDDEQEVHDITKMALADVVFKNKKLTFLDAYSAQEAELVLRSEEDIAVILLDVVMESDNAGLELTKVIRETLNNEASRIILRTGQPGQAPEERVILDYDINDYKSKNELTARKLMTTVVASLRAYDSIQRLQRNRRGLEQIIGSTDTLFEIDTLMDFSSGVLTQLSAFIDCKPNGIMCMKLSPDSAYMQGLPCEGIKVLGASGSYAGCNGCEGHLNCNQTYMVDLARTALEEKRNCYIDDYAVLYLDAKGFEGSVALLHGVKSLSEEDKFLLSIFTKKISLALANAVHYGEMISAQEAATIDFLTGLPNRRNLIDEANWLIDKHQNAGSPYALAILDIDFFKAVNDTYGHDIGDQVLKAVARYLDAELPEGCFAARIGGEEFCLFISDLNTDEAVAFFDKLRTGIAQLTIPVGDKNLSITVSIGITASSGDIDTMMKDADIKLYEAKNSGRNRVAF